MRHIAVVTGNYPSARRPNCGTFVHQFVSALAESGIACSVINPRAVHECFNRSPLPAVRAQTPGVSVYHPLMLSVSNKRVGPWNTFSVTQWQFRRAVSRALDRLPTPPDAVYGHFLYSAGAAAVQEAYRRGRPGFVRVGEGNFWTVAPLGVDRARRDFGCATGAVAVSRILRQRLIDQLGFPEERVAVFPNGVDLQRFFPRDRNTMRQKYRLPADRFLAIYVGNFIEPKGVNRVAAAIDGLEGVSGLYVGSGPLAPKGAKVEFCRRVRHDEVADLMSAADCFILPSDVEGCSNATLEAMACGLPVIVSDGAFNDEIVNDRVALRVPPLDVNAIREAIGLLVSDPQKRASMSDCASRHARDFDLRARAKAVVSWMQEMADSRIAARATSTP